MKTLKNILQFVNENVIETLILAGTIFIFIGMFLIFKPLAFIVIGLIAILLALIIYKNQ